MEKTKYLNGIEVRHVFPDEQLNINKIVKQLSILATQIYKENLKVHEFVRGEK